MDSTLTTPTGGLISQWGTQYTVRMALLFSWGPHFYMTPALWPGDVGGGCGRGTRGLRMRYGEESGDDDSTLNNTHPGFLKLEHVEGEYL